MKQFSVIHNTFVIERHYPTTAARVFAAFSNKEKKRRWHVDGKGFAIDEFEMDFRVGGKEIARFRYENGPQITVDTVYQDIILDNRIVFVYSMRVGDKTMSSSLTTVEFLQAKNGTDLIFTEQDAFFDGIDNVKGREEGTRAALEQLGEVLGNE
ncbi:MAG: SRPBCC family protein [Spirochaetia bacterium]|nr:SRPBCC family protein [Spirochaetia bacterium]